MYTVDGLMVEVVAKSEGSKSDDSIMYTFEVEFDVDSVDYPTGSADPHDPMSPGFETYPVAVNPEIKVYSIEYYTNNEITNTITDDNNTTRHERRVLAQASELLTMMYNYEIGEVKRVIDAAMEKELDRLLSNGDW